MWIWNASHCGICWPLFHFYSLKLHFILVPLSHWRHPGSGLVQDKFRRKDIFEFFGSVPPAKFRSIQNTTAKQTRSKLETWEADWQQSRRLEGEWQRDRHWPPPTAQLHRWHPDIFPVLNSISKKSNLSGGAFQSIKFQFASCTV